MFRLPVAFRPVALVILVALAAGSHPLRADEAAPNVQLLLATTTSVRDSGLLDVLLPVFRQRTGILVQVVAVGTGAALRMGSEGNADVLVTHAEAGERALVESGAALARRPFMENHFVIAGPAEDPARAGDATSPAEAYRRIAASEAPYVSRGDDSGTHRKEVQLLGAAGLDPSGDWPGFASTGSGMGLTLQVAGERRAYVLSDLGTFLAYRDRIGLASHSGPHPSLRNVYAVLRIDPERFEGRVRGEPARLFEEFLLDPETQRLIGSYGRERFGQPLFRPLAARGASAP